MAYWLSQFRPASAIPLGEPSNTSILHLLKMVLELNNFQFNGKHYLQVGGTAMGTRVAPTLANIFMADFERKYVYTYNLQPLVWVRFIDDIFLIWTHGRQTLEDFIQFLNGVHTSIKFTSEISDSQIPFLDTWVKKSENSLYTDLYTKPTDANNFLHFDSAHPPHCKRGIPFGQFLMIRRICTKKEDYDTHGLLKAAHFLHRGYPSSLVIDGFLKARAIDRKTLLTQRGVTTAQNPSILVTTLHPTFNDLGRIANNLGYSLILIKNSGHS